MGTKKKQQPPIAKKTGKRIHIKTEST